MILEHVVSFETIKRLKAAKAELTKAEEAFQAEALKNLPPINGKKLEVGSIVEIVSGLQYEVRSVSCYANSSYKTMGVTIGCRRRYKEGRRSGHTANSTTYLTYGEIHDIVNHS